MRYREGGVLGSKPKICMCAVCIFHMKNMLLVTFDRVGSGWPSALGKKVFFYLFLLIFVPLCRQLIGVSTYTLLITILDES